MNDFWKQKIDNLSLDKIFVLDNFSFVQDKKYFVQAYGRGIGQKFCSWFFLSKVIQIDFWLPAAGGAALDLSIFHLLLLLFLHLSLFTQNIPYLIFTSIVKHWYYIGTALAPHWHCIGTALTLHWLSNNWHCFALHCIESAIALHWLCIWIALALH